MALAEFEETAVDAAGRGGGRKAGAVAERKVVVLRRAVGLNPFSVGLREALLRACEGYLPADDLSREWDTALAQLPGSIALWSRSLALKARSFGSFTVPSLREAGAKAISSLAAQREIAISAGAATEEVGGIERASLLLALRAAHSERAAGFDERAIALVQARSDGSGATSRGQGAGIGG